MCFWFDSISVISKKPSKDLISSKGVPISFKELNRYMSGFSIIWVSKNEVISLVVSLNNPMDVLSSDVRGEVC